MANMQMTKTPMPEQDPNVRNKNFKEVTLGYTAEMAINEAQRCMQCKKPKCVEGCPVNIRIPEFIAKVAEGDFAAAYEVITSTNALPALSGRVCPQETQCESKCVRGVKGEPVAIGRLERFVADWYRENVNAMPQKAQSNGIKVAVVGSGPLAGSLAARAAFRTAAKPGNRLRARGPRAGGAGAAFRGRGAGGAFRHECRLQPRWAAFGSVGAIRDPRRGVSGEYACRGRHAGAAVPAL